MKTANVGNWLLLRHSRNSLLARLSELYIFSDCQVVNIGQKCLSRVQIRRIPASKGTTMTGIIFLGRMKSRNEI